MFVQSVHFLVDNCCFSNLTVVHVFVVVVSCQHCAVVVVAVVGGGVFVVVGSCQSCLFCALHCLFLLLCFFGFCANFLHCQFVDCSSFAFC